jgi:hypothetical protein
LNLCTISTIQFISSTRRSRVSNLATQCTQWKFGKGSTYSTTFSSLQTKLYALNYNLFWLIDNTLSSFFSDSFILPHFWIFSFSTNKNTHSWILWGGPHQRNKMSFLWDCTICLWYIFL